MFEGTLVESTGLLRPRNYRSVYLSVLVQAAIAAVLLSIPLVHPEMLPLHVPSMSLVAPLPKPQLPRMRVPERVHVESATAMAAPRAPSAPLPSGPRIAHFADPTNPSGEPPSSGPINIGGSGSGDLSSVLISGPGNSGSPRIVAAVSGSGARMRISQGVSSGLLLSPIRPVYPVIAKAAHVEGTVIVQAVISRAGTIESARILSGPAMLQAAALEAVERARYRPYLLNGEPTEVDTTFTVAFHLGS